MLIDQGYSIKKCGGRKFELGFGKIVQKDWGSWEKDEGSRNWGKNGLEWKKIEEKTRLGDQI